MSHQQHRAAAPVSVACFVLTVSDTRTEATDTSGAAIADLLQAHGHRVAGRGLVRDDAHEVRAIVEAALGQADVQVVIATGGTGISSRDSTYEAVSGLLEKQLDGFGELFRMLSFADVGPAAMLSRAMAGVVRRKVVVLLPGSEAAVRLAMTRLLLPELGHLVREVTR